MKNMKQMERKIHLRAMNKWAEINVGGMEIRGKKERKSQEMSRGKGSDFEMIGRGNTKNGEWKPG